MRHAPRYAALLLVASWLAATPAAEAGCTRVEPGYLWNYDGDIGGKYRARMTLVFGASSLEGVYFYATQLRDIRLRGRISEDGRSVLLEELNPDGSVNARFEGGFPTRWPARYGDSELQCEVITGRWTRTGAAESLPFFFASESATAGSLKHRYGAIGVRDDEVVHRGAARFWRAIKSGDRATVAAQVRYPIAVSLGGRSLRLKGPKDLLARYDELFHAEYRDEILKGLPRNMFVRDQGAMLGSGSVWFGADGKVIAFGNF
jgi:hypothetical protein